RWIKRGVAVADVTDLAAIETEIAGAGAGKSNLLLELDLRGTIALDTDAEITARLALLEPSLFHLVTRRAELTLDAGGAGLAALRDPQLVRVAEHLDAMRATDGESAIAEGALRRLIALSRQLEGQGS
ncbi:MAG: hypothetical protein ABL904_15625, partial [Hyphomicrobiaceae bacterium]